MAEDKISHPPKPKSPAVDLSSDPPKNTNPTKSHTTKFLYKAALVTVFLILLPFFPSIAPQFINQTLHARSWELLQLILVGIAVSYGLFSQKNDDLTEKDHSAATNATTNNNAQSILSKLLEVSSVFDEDESESQATIEESVKVQTLNSQQHYRAKPVVMVARPDRSPVKVGSCEFSQKPLLLPVRSLKQPGYEEGDSGDVAVRRSPIPWRSRSGKDFATSYSDHSSSLYPAPASESRAKSSEDDGLSPPPPLPPWKPPVLSKSNSAFAVPVSPEKKVLRRSVTGVRKEEPVAEKIMMMESSDEDHFEGISSSGNEEAVVVDGDDDDDGDNNDNNNDNNCVDDVGPDVDKKADEFIAKFREQIRLQRIESIRKSTAQRAKKASR